MRSVLISGFEAFHNHSCNVTEMLVNQLRSTSSVNMAINTVILPVVRWKSTDILMSAISAHNPSAVIALGQSRRPGISLERLAHNHDHFKIPDNAGNQPLNSAIINDGPISYNSTLPLKEMFNVLNKADIPVHYSQSAGTYVCNHVFYGLMHTIGQRSINAGFIHMPMLPEQVNHPDHLSLAFEIQLHALNLMLDTVHTHLNHPE